MLVTEPILLLLSMYIALIYGLLYAFFFSFPVVFGEDYRWNDGLVGLTFISVWIGLGLALAVMPLLQRDYMRRAAAKGGKAEPEDRLVGMLVGSIWVPICKFINIFVLFIDTTNAPDSSIYLWLDLTTSCLTWRR